MILEESALITPASLPIAISRPDGDGRRSWSVDRRYPDRRAVARGQRAAGCWRALWRRTTGNQTQAARLLRITRDTLRYKMKKFNLR